MEKIWATLYSAVSIATTVSVLLGGFYLIGCSIIKLLRLPHVAGSSVGVSVGMASVIFLGWYAYKLDMPLNIFLVCVFFLAVVLSIFKLAIVFQKGFEKKSKSISILPIFAIAFSVQALLAFNATSYSIGVLGNNDIYDWSILAQHLLGEPGYSNVFTTLGGSAQQNRIDSFGTFFTIAFVAKFLGVSPVEASTTFTIAFLSLIGLSVFDVIRKAFGFDRGVSFFIALLVPAGSFFFYIAYDSFYGQLIATFFYITLINSLLWLVDYVRTNTQANFAKRLGLPIFSIIGILITYQSGFVVFMVFAILFNISYSIILNIQSGTFFQAVTSLRLSMLPLLGAIVLSIILLPELSLHTAHRTMAVKSALNGWPLPLIYPAYLLSIPTSQGFPNIAGTVSQFGIALSVMMFIFGLAYRKAKKNSLETASRHMAFVMYFCLLFGAYMIAYHLRGGIYQVWKLASFVVLPMSFIFYVSIAFIWQHTELLNGFFKKLLLPVLAILAIYVVAYVPSQLALVSITGELEKMKESKSLLLDQGVENVVINGMSYSETMMAFNVLSRTFRIYPLVQTYVHPIDISVVQGLDESKTRVLVSSECYSGKNDVAGKSYKIIPLRELRLAGGLKYYFRAGGYDCPNSAVKLVGGFSGRETWGVWTEGNKSQMLIDVPPALLGSEITLVFKVQSFGPSQSVTVNIGNYSERWSIAGATVLSVKLPAERVQNKQLEVSFNIENPQSPSSTDQASTDTRKLGIGFIELNMMAGN